MHAAQLPAARLLVRQRLLIPVALAAGLGGRAAPPLPSAGLAYGAMCLARPPLYRIDLAPTERAGGAHGVARLLGVPTPFGLPVTPDGHAVFDVEVTASGLPDPASLGPYATYVAWAATPNLERVERLGELRDGSAKGRVTWNKFLVFVTAEAGPSGARWSGPVMLRGMSASGYMQNFSAHPLFNGGVPPC